MLSSLFQALYNSVLEKTQTIEQVNVVGGRFIREAKVRCWYALYQKHS